MHDTGNHILANSPYSAGTSRFYVQHSLRAICQRKPIQNIEGITGAVLKRVLTPTASYGATAQPGLWPLQSSASKRLYPLPKSSSSCTLTHFLVSLSNESTHNPLGISTNLLLSVYTFSTFLGTLSSILNTRPTHWSLLNLISLVSSI
jgi:hypothetical protein